MTAHTLAARQTVREIRESLSRSETTPLMLRQDLYVAISHFKEVTEPAAPFSAPDYESIELWARLAADLAGLLQQKKKPL